MTQRLRIAGIVSARSTWSSRISGWAEASTLPIDFIKFVSLTEFCRIDTASFDALMLDENCNLDNESLTKLTDAQISVIVIGLLSRDLAATIKPLTPTILSPEFDSSELLEIVEKLQAEVKTPLTKAVDVKGQLIAVTGAGGSGASTVAIAIAQQLGKFGSIAGATGLLDAKLRGNLALLHDIGDVIPGVDELIESARAGVVTRMQVRDVAFPIPQRNYDVIAGAPKHNLWTTWSRSRVERVIDGLRDAYRIIVADVDHDIEGEAESGALEIEERNVLARTILSNADHIVLTIANSISGFARGVNIVNELKDFGCDIDALTIVLNESRRNPFNRDAADLRTLLSQSAPHAVICRMNWNKSIEASHRDVSPIDPELIDSISLESLLSSIKRSVATETPVPIPKAQAS